MFIAINSQQIASSILYSVPMPV